MKIFIPIFAAFFSIFCTEVLAQNMPACTTPPPTAAENCDGICAYCNSINGYSGTTAGYTYPTGGLPPFCGSIENDQWMGFVAGANNVTISATPSNCTNGDGIQIALYSGCSGQFIQCNGGCAGCGNNTQSITATNLILGKSYFLLLDGFAGDNCDFSISVSPTTAATAQPPGVPGVMTGPSSVCANSTNQFCIPIVLNSGMYEWTVPSDATINGISGAGPIYLPAPTGNCATVLFGSSIGVKQVCVKPTNSCFSGVQVCKTVTVEVSFSSPPTGPALQTFCANNPPTVANLVAIGTGVLWFNSPTGGSPLMSSTPLINSTHYYASQNVNGCESLTRLDVTVALTTTPPVSDYCSQSFCIGDNPTIASLAPAGSDIKWYNSSTGGSPLATTTALVNGTDYYVTRTTAGCESARSSVMVAVRTPAPGHQCFGGCTN